MTAHRRLGLDRHDVRFRARVLVNERRARWVCDFGLGWQFAVDAQEQALTQNTAWHEVRRARWDMKHMSACYKREYLARLRRYVERPRKLRERFEQLNVSKQED